MDRIEELEEWLEAHIGDELQGEAKDKLAEWKILKELERASQ